MNQIVKKIVCQKSAKNIYLSLGARVAVGSTGATGATDATGATGATIDCYR